MLCFYFILGELFFISDGPLEKFLRGWGIFELRELFFVNISLAGIIIFRPVQEYFLKLLGTHGFFQKVFPFTNIFLVEYEGRDLVFVKYITIQYNTIQYNTIQCSLFNEGDVIRGQPFNS